MFGNDVTKSPDYRMKLVEILPLIDDIDGTPMKTTYRVVFGDQKPKQWFWWCLNIFYSFYFYGAKL